MSAFLRLSTMGSFDEVGIEFDAAVVGETGEPIPVMHGIADGFGDWGLGRDAGELSTWSSCGSGWRGCTGMRMPKLKRLRANLQFRFIRFCLKRTVAAAPLGFGTLAVPRDTLIPTFPTRRNGHYDREK